MFFLQMTIRPTYFFQNSLVIFFLFTASIAASRSGKQNDSETSKENKLLFYRSGWPKENFNLSPGATAMLSCNQIRFNGDVKTAPAATIRWFKDGKLIRSIPGKTKIFGTKKKPSINGTRLNLIHLNETDAGVYTCKLALRKDSNPDYILSMNFTVKVKKADHDETAAPSIGISLPLHQNDLQKEQQKSLVIIIATSVACFVVLLVLSAYVLKKMKLGSCKQQDNKAPQCGDPTVVLSHALPNSSKDIPVKIRSTESITTFPNSRLLKLSQAVDEEPKYVNVERYKDYFPFIKDNEWELLQRSQINRSRVKCQVEHAMPIVLGTGNFGQVYQGEMLFQDGTTRSVAVKRLNDGCKTKELGHFLKEAVTLLKAGYHPNVISLLGCVLIDSLEDLGMEQKTKKPPILLMEVAQEGNLKSFLQSRRLSDSQKTRSCEEMQSLDNFRADEQCSITVGKNLTVKNLTSFIYQAAKGMQHLANKKIVHRDLAARNVLLTSDHVIKIADFGLSKHMRELQQEYYRIHSPSITPAKWTAPEALNENVFSIKSDVWSFGILTWEILMMGESPYLGVPLMQLYRQLAAGKRLPKPDFAFDSIYAVMQQCWSWDAQNRPDFDELVNIFEERLLAVSEPYLELHGREDSLLSCRSSDESESFSQRTPIILDFNHHSARSNDSGRSSDSVFTFSSGDLTDDVIDSFEEVTLESKISEANELINPGYGIMPG